jgi:hypothetical protein
MKLADFHPDLSKLIPVDILEIDVIKSLNILEESIDKSLINIPHNYISPEKYYHNLNYQD